MFTENLAVAFLVIFALKVFEVALGTMRMIYVLHGQKALASLIGFVEVSIFIFAVSQVIASITHANWYLAFAYSGGFALGTYVGLHLEERFAIGFTQLRIISPGKGEQIAHALWERDFGGTVVQAHGRRGPVQLVFSVVPRHALSEVMELSREIDEHSFISISDNRRIVRGHIGRHVRK